MTTSPSPPKFPAGSLPAPGPLTAQYREGLIAELEKTSALFEEAVSGLSPDALDTPYNNWTIRQIVHHVTDSHTHSYIRFKWTLTEDEPTIKAYDEVETAKLADSARMPIEPSLLLLQGLHVRWSALLRPMSDTDFVRGFIHPEHGARVPLDDALIYYPWHARHHAAQIRWVREHRLTSSQRA